MCCYVFCINFATCWQGTQQRTKALEAAAFFRDGHGEERFTLLADLGPLGDKAQAVKVHVGAAQNRRKSFAFDLVFGDILLDGRHRQRASGLDDAAGVNKHVFDGGADRVGVDLDVVVHQAGVDDAKGLFADQFDCRAV